MVLEGQASTNVYWRWHHTSAPLNSSRATIGIQSGKQLFGSFSSGALAGFQERSCFGQTRSEGTRIPERILGGHRNRIQLRVDVHEPGRNRRLPGVPQACEHSADRYKVELAPEECAREPGAKVTRLECGSIALIEGVDES